MKTIKVVETEGEYTIKVTKEEEKRIIELTQQGVIERVKALSMCRRIASEQGVKLPYNIIFDFRNPRSPAIMEVHRHNYGK